VLLPLKLIAVLWFSLHGRSATEADLDCERAVRGADSLVLVNKSDRHSLAKRWRPNDLVKLPKSVMKRGRRGALRKEAGRALKRMLGDARSAGHKIRVLSAYRSFRTQKRVFRSKARRYGHRRARRVSAKAGHSQHQLGTTVDLVAGRFDWRLTQLFAYAPEGKWLEKNAHRYGFALSYPEGKEKLTGYIHEPWHYRYLGAKAAREMKKLGMPMESYLQECHRCSSQLVCPTSAAK
jgi:D-alanyl-D-alanine carboxypeptidase